jgi:hypothetical protein
MGINVTVGAHTLCILVNYSSNIGAVPVYK